jgi:phage baseplate assembly protein W
LNVVITDFTGDLNLLMAPVLLWLTSESSRIARRDDGSLLSVLINQSQNGAIRPQVFTAACTTDY